MRRSLGAARVLYVTQHDPSRKFGSLEECIVLLAEQSRARGGVLIPAFSGSVSTALSDRLAACDTPFVPSLDLGLWRWSLARRFLSLVDRYAIDVVDFSFYPPLNPYVALLRAVRPRVRSVYTDHRSRYPERDHSTLLRRVWRRIVLNQYHLLFAISNFNHRALRKDGAQRVARCQLFINPTRFHFDLTVRERIRTELSANRDFVALIVAHLIRWKGVDVALRAMAAASDSARLWIVGTGPELEKLQSLASELGLDSRACFVGEQRDVSPYLQGADCLICPSIWHEAMGFVNLEAMASRLPVLASRIGGIPEIVDDETSGLLVDSGDVGQLAMALRRLISSPDFCLKLGTNGVARVSARYSKEACLERYLEGYDIAAGISDGRLDFCDTRSRRNRFAAGAPNT
jgi:glycosyltransferase involved in cell wall biosynthesis